MATGAQEWQRHVHEICKLYWPAADTNDAVVRYHVLWFPAFNRQYGPESTIGVRKPDATGQIYELLPLSSIKGGGAEDFAPVPELGSIRFLWRGANASPATIQWENAPPPPTDIDALFASRILQLQEIEDGEPVCTLGAAQIADSRYTGLAPPLDTAGVLQAAASFSLNRVEYQSENHVELAPPVNSAVNREPPPQKMVIWVRETLESAISALKNKHPQISFDVWAQLSDFFATFGFLQSVLAPNTIEYVLRRQCFIDSTRSLTCIKTTFDPKLAQFVLDANFPAFLRGVSDRFGDKLQLRPTILAHHCIWLAYWCRAAGTEVGEFDANLLEILPENGLDPIARYTPQRMHAVFKRIIEQTLAMSERHKYAQQELLQMLFWLRDTFSRTQTEYQLVWDFGSKSSTLLQSGKLKQRRGVWLAKLVCQRVLVTFAGLFEPIGTMHAWKISNCLDPQTLVLWLQTLDNEIAVLQLMHLRRDLDYKAADFLHVRRRYRSTRSLTDQTKSGIGVRAYMAAGALFTVINEQDGSVETIGVIEDPDFCVLGFFGATDNTSKLVPCPRYRIRIRASDHHHRRNAHSWQWLQNAFRRAVDNPTAKLLLELPTTSKRRRQTAESSTDDKRRRESNIIIIDEQAAALALHMLSV